MIPTAQPVILAGGYGTRLWLLSRSLLQEEVSRTLRLKNVRAPLVVARRRGAVGGLPPARTTSSGLTIGTTASRASFPGWIKGLTFIH